MQALAMTTEGIIVTARRSRIAAERMKHGYRYCAIDMDTMDFLLQRRIFYRGGTYINYL